jgi:hypothetical protein
MSKSYSDSAPGVNAQAQVSYKQNPTPSYYAVIPASVRYHPDLPPAAKLMYGEITALSNIRGYCWAGNDYFMQLYDVSRATVKSWIASLVKAGFVEVEVAQDRQSRKIKLSQYFLNKTLPEPVAAVEPSSAKQDSDVARNLATGRQKSDPVVLKEKTERISRSGKNVSTAQGQLPPSDEQKQVGGGGLSPAAIYAPGGAKFVGPGPVKAGELSKEILQDGEDAVSASPINQDGASPSDALSRVDLVVALTGDVKSRSRFGQLWNICKKSRQESAWVYAYDATKTALEARSGVSNPGAYFHAILRDRLALARVHVPIGPKSEQDAIRQAIRESLALSK